MPKVTVTNASTLKIPSSTGRKGLILDNVSANDVYFRFSGPVSASGTTDAGIRLRTNERLVLMGGQNGTVGGALFMIAPAGNSDLVYEDIL